MRHVFMSVSIMLFVLCAFFIFGSITCIKEPPRDAWIGVPILTILAITSGFFGYLFLRKRSKITKNATRVTIPTRLLATIALGMAVTSSALFPPWTVWGIGNGRHVELAPKYAFLLSPPVIEDGWSIGICWSVLALEWVAIIPLVILAYRLRARSF
jgi:H+/Cl- antiporter ClcA